MFDDLYATYRQAQRIAQLEAQVANLNDRLAQRDAEAQLRDHVEFERQAREAFAKADESLIDAIYDVKPDTSGKALTYDAGKEPLAWLPWDAIDAMSRVQMYGHGKYKDFNNYRKGMEVSRNLSCAIRHIRDYLQGENEDHESGINPLAHAMCRIAFVLQNIAEGTAIDDRFKKPVTNLQEGSLRPE